LSRFGSLFAKIVTIHFSGVSRGDAICGGMKNRLNQLALEAAVITPIEYAFYSAGMCLFIASGMRTMGLA